MRVRLNVYFPPELAKQVDELAIRRRISRSAIVEAAVATYLSPDGADRLEAAFARRLDRLSRQVQRLERNTGLTTEALALFVRFWLSVTPLPTLAAPWAKRSWSLGATLQGCQQAVDGDRTVHAGGHQVVHLVLHQGLQW